MIKVYDIDDFSPNAPLASHDYVGELEFMLHEVVTSNNQTLKRALKNNLKPNRHNGFILITGDERSG